MPLLTAKHHSHSEVCSEAQRARDGTTSGAGPEWPAGAQEWGGGGCWDFVFSYSFLQRWEWSPQTCVFKASILPPGGSKQMLFH